MSETRSRLSLTVKEKREISAFYLKWPDKCHQDLADHFSAVWKKPIKRRTVGDIIKGKDRWMAQASSDSGLSVRKMRPAKHDAMEKAVFQWYTSARGATSCPITPDILKSKAVEFGTRLNVTDFNYSSGWMARFKQRYGIQFRTTDASDTIGGESKIESKDETETESKEIADVDPAVGVVHETGTEEESALDEQMKNKAEHATMLKGLRRVRKPNYTREETEILLDQLLVYGNFLFGKSQPGVNNQQRADVWANIAAMVNAVPNSAGRTVEELKHRWQDLAQRARTALRRNSDDNKQHVLQKQMPYMEQVLRIMGESRSYVSSKGSPSPVPSGYASDFDASFCMEIKQEKGDSAKESPVILKQTVNSLKRVLPPLRTPSLKRFKEGRTFDSLSITDLSGQHAQNGISSLGAAAYSSLSHPNLVMDTPPGAVSLLQTSAEQRKPSVSAYAAASPSHTSQSARPMVMDPESHLIMEVDLMDEDRTSGSAEANDEDQEVYDRNSLLVSSEANVLASRDNAAHGNTGCVNGFDKCGGGDDDDGNVYSQLHREKSKSESTELGTHYGNPSKEQQLIDETHNPLWEAQHLETLTTPQLQRLCLIGKIRLQNQQRSYVKLKEEKLRLEMEFLNTKTFPQLSKPTGCAPVYNQEESLQSNVYDSDHSEKCPRHEHPGLSPISVSGGLDFEVANDCKHQEKIGGRRQGGATDKSNGKTRDCEVEDEEGGESDNPVIEEPGDGEGEEMKSREENHLRTESEISDADDTSPKHDMM